MPFIQTRHVRLHYRVVGSGPRTLVFVHGNLASLDWWELALAALPDDCTAYAFDLRGCGLSDKPEPEADYANYAFDVLADDVAEALGLLGIEQYHYVGHSTGGLIGLRLVVRPDSGCLSYFGLDPAGVRGVDLTDRMHIFQRARNDHDFALALISSTMNSLFDDVDLTGGVGPRPSARATPAQIDLVHRLAAQRHIASDGIWFGIARHLTAEATTQPMRAALPSVTIPMTVAWGELDLWIDAETMDELGQLVPHCVRRRLPGIGQSMMVEDPQGFVELLADHLDRCL